MIVSPMKPQDDMTAAADGPLLVMVKGPIGALPFGGALVLGSQGIIERRVNGAGGIAVVVLEITDQELQQGQPQVVRIPGTAAEEIGEVAGIDAGEFQGRQLGQGLASWGHDEEV